MIYTAALPSVALRPYICRYWTLRGTFLRQESITLLPDGGAHLVVNLGEGVCSLRHGNTLDAEGTHLVGAMLQSDVQGLVGEQHLVGVTFQPGAFVCFYRWDPMTLAANRVQPFEQPLPKDGVRRCADVAQLASFLDRYYLDRLEPGRATLATVLADIEASRGQVRIDGLLRRHAVTARSLERQFAQLAGIAPKELIDLTRFKHALQALERDQGRHTLARIARDSGYYDGAHLTNAFKRYTGQPPSRFALSDLSKSASSGSDTVTG